MGEHSNISWTHHTASPWFGCTEVSPGCANCYARELTLQKKWAGWGDNMPRVRSKGFWKDVYRWDKKAEGASERPRTFTSLMDCLDPRVPIAWFAQYIDVIRKTVHLDHLLLTKRPELFKPRMEQAIEAICGDNEGEFFEAPEDGVLVRWMQQWLDGDAPYHVWFGVTAEDQKRYDERAPILASIPARVRWFSFEPLLESLHLGWERPRLAGAQTMPGPLAFHWAVIGGESGRNRRDCSVYAICWVAEQCVHAGVPVFIKQDCALKPGQQGRMSDELWKWKQFPK